jgi:alpha-ketoglutaric semialdehyde dehydrogenase
MSGVATPVRPNVYIGGEWRAAATGEQYEKVDPMRPTTVLGPFASAGRADVDAAVSAADAHFGSGPHYRLHAAATFSRTWPTRSPDASTSSLVRCLSRWDSQFGKRAVRSRAIQILRYAGGAALRPSGLHFEQMGTTGRISTRRRPPLGVVGLITPSALDFYSDLVTVYVDV